MCITIFRKAFTLVVSLCDCRSVSRQHMSARRRIMLKVNVFSTGAELDWRSSLGHAAFLQLSWQIRIQEKGNFDFNTLQFCQQCWWSIWGAFLYMTYCRCIVFVSSWPMHCDYLMRAFLRRQFCHDISWLLGGTLPWGIVAGLYCRSSKGSSIRGRYFYHCCRKPTCLQVWISIVVLIRNIANNI